MAGAPTTTIAAAGEAAAGASDSAGDATLHKFSLPVGHPCLDSRKPFTRMATSDKFELAENFIGDYFAAVEYQVVSDVEKNRFTVALLECVTYLAEYGFFGECVGECMFDRLIDRVTRVWLRTFVHR